MNQVEFSRSQLPRSAMTGWLAVSAVTLGIFALMTSELLPVGVLTPVASDLRVSEGVAGLMVTVPGLVAAFSAPLVTVATGRFDRRLVLCILIGVVGLANLASALATNFGVVLLARFLIGISVGGFWAIAGGIAVRLVPEKQVVRATAVIFFGVESASVLGVPAGTLLGDLLGWRFAFAAVGVLGLLSLIFMVLLMPAVPAERTITLRELPRIFRANIGVRMGVAVTFLLVTGHFLAYTYLRPVLIELADVNPGAIGLLLLVFGVAGICGNFIAGAMIERDLRATVVGIALLMSASVLLVALVGSSVVSAAILLVFWGLAYGGVPVTLQTWILRAAPDTPEAASSMYVSMFNASIALGALLGGIVVDNIGVAAVLWIGGVLALLAVIVVGATTPSALARSGAGEPAS